MRITGEEMLKFEAQNAARIAALVGGVSDGR